MKTSPLLRVVVAMVVTSGLCHVPRVAAAPETYAIDPVHTRVMMAVSHAGFSHAIGTVSGSSGQLEFDPQDWKAAKLQVSVPLQRLDMGDEKWNKAVLASNLLDAARYPVATFVSTRIEPIDAQHASVVGNLSLHGVTREVKLDVTFNLLKRHPLPPFRRTAGFSATTSLSRADFGIDAWKSVIGDSVELRLEVEATRAKGRGTTESAEAESKADADADADVDVDTEKDPEKDPEPQPATEPTKL